MSSKTHTFKSCPPVWANTSTVKLSPAYSTVSGKVRSMPEEESTGAVGACRRVNESADVDTAVTPPYTTRSRAVAVFSAVFENQLRLDADARFTVHKPMPVEELGVPQFVLNEDCPVWPNRSCTESGVVT